MFVKGSYIKKKYQISSTTLRNWDNKGLIKAKKALLSNHRLYELESVEQALGVKENERTKIRDKAIYARVSSQHQTGDLRRQIDELTTAYPDHKLFKDVGSGLNFHRPGLKALLEQVHQGNVSEVVVLHRDRLCRFAFELMEWIFKKAGTKLVVHSKSTADCTTDESELQQDLLSIVHYFLPQIP